MAYVVIFLLNILFFMFLPHDMDQPSVAIKFWLFMLELETHKPIMFIPLSNF